jgi:dTDP-glucose pyrophosphorylase
VLGVIPAAGSGSRIQPLAFSKELLPVGSRRVDGAERPRAVSEYLIERLITAGATRLCFVIGPEKLDIVRYFGAAIGGVPLIYVVQPRPAGLCDALFRAVPVVRADEPVAIGLPDTIWYPADALARADTGGLAFVLFPVARPELFDAVAIDPEGRVREIRVKSAAAGTPWVWGALRMPGNVFLDLHALWIGRAGQDEYLGSLVNAWIAQGGIAQGVRAGRSYVDVGTLNGYRAALDLLRAASDGEPSGPSPDPAHPVAGAA